MQDLPSIFLASKLGLSESIIIPGKNQQSGFNQHCLEMLGLKSNPNQDLISPLLHVRELRLVRATILHSSGRDLFRGLFEKHRVCGQLMIYISRSAAKYRRIANESEVCDLMRDLGVRVVRMELLSPGEQIDLMRRARVVVGLHGAGLTNIAFCSRGAHLIEILNSERGVGNQDIFRKLCSSLGAAYWPVGGRADREKLEAGQADVWVDIEHLRSVVVRVIGLAGVGDDCQRNE